MYIPFQVILKSNQISSLTSLSIFPYERQGVDWEGRGEERREGQGRGWEEILGVAEGKECVIRIY